MYNERDSVVSIHKISLVGSTCRYINQLYSSFIDINDISIIHMDYAVYIM